MLEIGACKAKTHFSSLLDRVVQGEEVLITKHGRPVARLIPAAQVGREKTENAIRELRALRKGLKLSGLSWKALRDAGRR